MQITAAYSGTLKPLICERAFSISPSNSNGKASKAALKALSMAICSSGDAFDNT